MPDVAAPTLAGPPAAPVADAKPKRVPKLGALAWISIGWIGLIVFLAAFAAVLPIRDPEALGIITGEVERFESPGLNAWFGGDNQGKDLFANVVYGARAALALGVIVTLIAGTIGTVLGVIAGFRRGFIDDLIMAATDIALAFPALVLLIAVRASFGNSLLVFIVIFSILGIAPYTRIVRGATLTLAEREFVQAAKSMGASRTRIITHEILPNVVLPVLSFAFIGFAVVIAAEGGLAFIGLSLEQTTWGKLIAEGRGEIENYAFLTLIPATVMFLTILAFNFLGDAIRQLTAPRDVATLQRHEIGQAPSPAPVAASDQPVLAIEHLTTRFDTPEGAVHAVEDVSLQVDEGEALAIVGESGSGKTMILRSILGNFPVSNVSRSGRVDLGRTDLLRAPEERRLNVLGTEIGTVSQNPLTALNPVRRIIDQITEPMVLHGELSKSEAKARAVELMQQVGIPDPRKRLREYPHQLSGGMRQRVTIAIALANSPDLLLADEPTTALDVTVQDQILRLIDGLRRETGMAVILVTHDLAVVQGFTDRVAIVYGGQIVETGPTREVFEHPRHQYTKALIKSIPDLALPPHTILEAIEGQPPSLLNAPTSCRFATRCPNVQDRCRIDVPERTTEGDHSFSCWYPVESVPVEVGDGR